LFSSRSVELLQSSQSRFVLLQKRRTLAIIAESVSAVAGLALILWYVAARRARAIVVMTVIGRLMGHTQPGTTARYAHVADSALRDATNNFPEILSPQKRLA
jgi:hypothetical protein